MREILFRAWDKVSKKYREFDGMHDTMMTINEDGKVEYYNLQNGSGGDEYILEQFTGLTDKNGVEIYEGDIGKSLYDNSHHTVSWVREGMWRCKDIAKGNDTVGYPLYQMGLDNFEIIGNIHDQEEDV